ncbi:restriction endonuclease subunit S [Rhodoferax sp.]|uniref:restriction endonuclease subunit S n=1 Tax=Rhodoferax sp. TaxID=50421 RepID=UPI00374D5573
MIADLKPYAAYKDSGLAWLGQVPGHWDVRKPRQIGLLLKGVGGTKEDALSAGVPCVRYGELYTTHTYFVRRPKTFVHTNRAGHYTPIRYGDVLFAASGETLEEIGKSAVNLIEDTAVCGGDVIILRPTVPVHAPFLGYAMDCRPAANQKATMGRGTTVKHIYADELKHLLFPFPPVAEQSAIVRFLDWANARLEHTIRAKRRVIALLTEQKQAIIHRAVTRGLDPAVLLKPSGIQWLGDIPAHWELQNLGRAIRLITGYPFASSGFTLAESGMRLVRGINVTPSGLRWNAVVRWERRPGDRLNEFALQVGDIVLGMDRPIIGSGVRAAAIEEKDTPSLLLQRVARLRPTARLDARFLLLLLRGRLFANYMTPIFTGISVPHLSPEQIKGFKVTLPPIKEQQEIVSYAESETGDLNTAISRLNREIDFLREYRTRLVADVVTGKLDVREAATGLPQDELEATITPEAMDADDDTASDEETGLEA